MSFNKPVQPSISFRGFRRRGDNKNPHGWGIAFYPDEAAQVIKEHIKAVSSPIANFYKAYPYLSSRIILAHVRRTSGTSVCYKNTHPFQRELNGKDYVFAHNGTLENYSARLQIGKYHPIGDTDSEYVFCHILSWINDVGIKTWTEDNFHRLAEKLRELNSLGNFNAIFSDGSYLFSYHDQGDYNGLSFVRREPPYELIHMNDEDFDIELAEEKDPSQKGFVIATKPLTDEQWISFDPGELAVFCNGEMIYSSAGRSNNESDNISDIKKNILRFIRKSPHRVSLKQIVVTLGIQIEQARSAILSLMSEGYLRQDGRDLVPDNHTQATFYTEPSKRQEIDDLLIK
jgi:glutamine amidotransferase